MGCNECGHLPANRLHGLCWTCSMVETIRDKWRQPTDFAPSEFGTDESGGIPEPTDALPGSERKIAVLEERARLNQVLFHPADARFGERRDLHPHKSSRYMVDMGDRQEYAKRVHRASFLGRGKMRSE